MGEREKGVEGAGVRGGAHWGMTPLRDSGGTGCKAGRSGGGGGDSESAGTRRASEGEEGLRGRCVDVGHHWRRAKPFAGCRGRWGGLNLADHRLRC